MRFTLSVTPTTLPRLEALRLAAHPTGGKPPVLNIPEADAAHEAARAAAHGELPSATPPVGRWLVRDVGPVVATWDALRPGGPGFVYSCPVDVEPLRDPPPARYR